MGKPSSHRSRQQSSVRDLHFTSRSNSKGKVYLAPPSRRLLQTLRSEKLHLVFLPGYPQRHAEMKQIHPKVCISFEARVRHADVSVEWAAARTK